MNRNWHCSTRFILGLLLSPTFSLLSLNGDFSVPLEEALISEYSFGLSDEVQELLADDVTVTTQLRISPADIVTFLVDEIGIIDILEEDFYLRTNPLTKRNVVDLPLFEPLVCGHDTPWQVGGHFFWNQTYESNFTKDSTHISCYLALTQETLLAKIQEAIDNLTPLLDVPTLNINQILCLFQNTKLQQRRISTLFYADRKWRRMHARLLLPVYYCERNFFLTDEERTLIEQQFGVMEENEQIRFQRAHLVSDRLGIGDLRIELDGAVWHSPEWSVTLGAMFTLPTAWDFKKGIYGSHFHKSCTIPSFDLDDLFDIADSAPNITEAQKAFAFSLVEQIMLCALDRLSANLLTAPLGNGGHVGVGIMMRTQTTLDQTPLSIVCNQKWTQDVSVCGRASLEYLIPADEKRFFIKRINPQEFASRDFSDPNQADDNLKFLEEKIIERIFPVALDTLVRPGFIFRWTTNLGYQRNHWGMRGTSDFWLQTGESFGDIDACQEDLDSYRIACAKTELAFQSKLGLTLFYNFDRPERSWYIALGAETTTFKSGIGRDWSAILNIESHF